MNVIAVTIETTEVGCQSDSIPLVSIHNHQSQEVASDPGKLKEQLEDPVVLKVFHDAIMGVTFLKSAGIEVTNYTDTMVMAQLVESNPSVSYSLQAVVNRHCPKRNEQPTQYSNERSTDVAVLDQHHGLKEAKAIYQLYFYLNQLIEKRHLQSVYNRERLVLPAIVEVSMTGLIFDYEGWTHVLTQIEAEADELIIEIKQTLSEKDLNLQSSQQLKAALHKLGVQVADTSDDALAKVEAAHPIIPKIRKWRKLQQRLNTFGEKFRDRIGEDGRVRGKWSQIGTATGRMSCKQPPLQGMPTQSRPYFKASPGNVLIIADYATIELRVLAYLTQSKALINAFNHQEDLHAITAASIFECRMNEVTEEQRSIGKVMNFGIIYGMTAYGIRNRISVVTGNDLTLQEAEQFRQRYFDKYPEVLDYQDRMLKAEVIRTLGGKEFGLFMPPLPLGSIKRYNYPIQSAAADGLKEALILLMKQKPPCYQLVHLIHDEIILEVPESEAVAASQLLEATMKKGMSKVIPAIPIEVETEIRKTWA